MSSMFGDDHGRKWRRAMHFRTTCQDPETDEGDGEGVPSIDLLPVQASDYFEDYHTMAFGWTPKLRTILAGVSDEQSPLRSFRGFEDSILRKIYSFVASEYVPHVKLTLPAKNTGMLYDTTLCRFKLREEYYGDFDEAEDLTSDFVSFASCGKITFPPPQDRNVNMMPFVLGDENSLPENLRCYYDCIKNCPIDPKLEGGKVCYLTVHESFVPSQMSQRRGGLHIETPGLSCASFLPGKEHHWGGGHFYSGDVYDGGIYFASSVANTSVVYNALVDKNVPGIVDKDGNCEHLRKVVGPGVKLEAGQLVWMTDRTPHEAIPQEEDGYRQFFRVVTSKVSHWFSQHSTPNPNVPLPDNVIIVDENKFQ